MFAIRYTIAALSLCLMMVQSAHAQVGRDSNYWSWTVSSTHHDAIVTVSLDGATGTGTIIAVNRDKPISDGFEGYCLTAYHVVEPDDDRRAIKVLYRNGGSSSECMIVRSDPELDIAILWVWVPSEIEPVPLSDDAVQYGDALELAGLGGATQTDGFLRSFVASAAAPTNEKTIYADVSLLPGDSGGPVFNDRQQVVGVISGGWFWWDGGIVTDAGNPITPTWPARAANLKGIQDLFDGVIPTVHRVASMSHEVAPTREE